MHIRIKRGWELPESAATPEAVFADRRRLIKGIAAGSLLLASGVLGTGARAAAPADPSARLYPFKQNPTYKLDRPLTAEDLATSYNNFSNSAPARTSRTTPRRCRSAPGRWRSPARWKS